MRNTYELFQILKSDWFREILQISFSIRNPVVWQGESNPAPMADKTCADLSGGRAGHKR